MSGTGYRMIILGIVCLLLISYSSASVSADTAEGAEIDKASLAYLIMETDTLQMLAQQNIDQTVNGTLLARMMTACIVLESTSITNQVTPTENSVSFDKKYSLSVASSYSVDVLLKAMLLGNADNAARALAQYVNPNQSQGEFINKMNQKAAQLGMTKTFFTNADGHADELQRTTVGDTALFMRYMIKNHPQFTKIYTSEAALIWDGSTVLNACGLVTEAFDGRQKAGGTFAQYDNEEDSLCAFTYFHKTAETAGADSMNLLMIVYGTSPDQYEQYGKALITNILDGYKKSRLISAGEMVTSIAVGDMDLTLLAAANVYCVMPVDITRYIQNISYTFLDGYSTDTIKPPITEGTHIGTAHYLLRDGSTHNVELVAGNTIHSQIPTVNRFVQLMEENKALFIIIFILLGCECILVLAALFAKIRNKLDSRKRFVSTHQ